MNKANRIVRLESVSASFPSLFKKTAYKDNKPKYSITVLFDPESPAHKVIKKAFTEILEELWKGKKPNGLKTCLHAGDEKIASARNPDTYAAYEGKLYVTASSDNLPDVRDRNPTVRLDSETGAAKIYGGAVIDLIVNLWAWDHPVHGPQINCELKGAQFVSAGERIGGGGETDVSDYFTDYEDGGDSSSSSDDDNW